MSRIRVELDVPVVNGKQVSFFSPIGSADARSILIHDVEYALVDSHGQALAKLDYSWTAGALVSVILDTSTSKAYVQNATSNAYIEDTFLRKDAKPEDIDAADRIHGHKLTDSNMTGTLAISKGGTGATTVAKSRKNLGLGDTDGAVPIANGGTGASSIGGARTNLNLGRKYEYNGNGGTQTIDTGYRGSNLLMIVGKSYVGWLTPHGGIMTEHGNTSALCKTTTFERTDTNATETAYYEDGYIYLKSDSGFINGDDYHYYCLCM